MVYADSPGPPPCGSCSTRTYRGVRTDPTLTTMPDPESNPETTDDRATEDTDADDDRGAERTTIRRGRDYEETFRLDAAEAGRFLVQVGEQLQKGDELTLTTEEWELPFAFGEPVELEVDFDGVEDIELEIEVELPGRTDERAPGVE